MHFAVAAKNLSMVRMLDEYGALGTTKNSDGICPIDVSITEDLRDIKLHFLAQQKYKNFDFSGLTGNDISSQGDPSFLNESKPSRRGKHSTFH